MKATELRLGNFIYADGLHGGVIKTVEGIDVKGTLREENRVILFKDHPVGEFIQHCKGIPLTEEWLLKFGFSFDKLNFYRLDKRLIVVRGKRFIDFGSDVELKYVHQLQNFFFALTGTELSMTTEHCFETK